MKVGLAFSTKNRAELTQQTIRPLLQPDKFDLWWIDGSTEAEAEHLPLSYPAYIHVHANVRGGADAAIVYALTTLLQAEQNYDVIGLCENDVLLDEDFFEPTMQLFARGEAEGMEVGAVSPRCYEDRILIQRDGHAITHNLGAGVVFFTRKAAKIALESYRTTWWAFNRRTFAQLSGIDIGKYAAFRANEQWCCADWGVDANLASCGLASLALTPSKCQMIGQIPSLAEQGLKLVTGSGDILHNEEAFAKFRENLAFRRNKTVDLPNQTQFHQHDDGSWLIFPHQLAAIGGKYEGDWRLKWAQGYGPFAWKAGTVDAGEAWQSAPGACPTLTVTVSGPCSFLVSGGEKGGKVEVKDLASGYEVTPDLPPEGPSTQVLNLICPSGVSYRQLRLTMLTPGTVFYGIQTLEQQPWRRDVPFDYSVLPPP